MAYLVAQDEATAEVIFSLSRMTAAERSAIAKQLAKELDTKK